MADELLLSMGDTEGIDYTMKEYMKLVAKTQACVDRLNEQGEAIFFTWYLSASSFSKYFTNLEFLIFQKI